MNAENLIKILESASYNMDVPLDKMIVEMSTPEGWTYQTDYYEYKPEENKIVIVTK